MAVQFGPDSSETCGGSTGPVLGQVVVRGQTVQKAVLCRSCRSLLVVDISVMVLRWFSLFGRP